MAYGRIAGRHEAMTCRSQIDRAEAPPPTVSIYGSEKWPRRSPFGALHSLKSSDSSTRTQYRALEANGKRQIFIGRTYCAVIRPFTHTVLAAAQYGFIRRFCRHFNLWNRMPPYLYSHCNPIRISLTGMLRCCWDKSRKLHPSHENCGFPQARIPVFFMQ